MPIFPLPQFEADLEEDRKVYEKLKPPTSIVVRFGAMKMVGEFPYDGAAKPGCGSKLVVRTHRGTELGEMLTSTCPNAGCSKSVTRKEMLTYIENSGGRDYPFFSGQGRVLRLATAEDMAEQARRDAMKLAMTMRAREHAGRLGLPMKIVEAEPILGGERLTFFFISEDRVDFRELVPILAAEFTSRIEMRQVGARDEARLVADYERCGQHCCCKQFLKVLKPVSMKSAKIQKATLDPLKISGRCGRLMCCLRYEDQTYDELRARLPKKKSRVTTPDGPGTVLDSQILTQLVLVKLDKDGTEIAVPVEELEPGGPPAPPITPASAPGFGPRPLSPTPAHPSPPRPTRDGAEAGHDPKMQAGERGSGARGPARPGGPRREERRARPDGHEQGPQEQRRPPEAQRMTDPGDVPDYERPASGPEATGVGERDDSGYIKPGSHGPDSPAGGDGSGQGGVRGAGGGDEHQGRRQRGRRRGRRRPPGGGNTGGPPGGRTPPGGGGGGGSTEGGGGGRGGGA